MRNHGTDDPWRLGRAVDNGNYRPDRFHTANLGAGNLQTIIPIVQEPQPERIAVRYGPDQWSPNAVNDDGVYVTTQQTHNTAFGVVTTPFVHRVRNIDIDDPALQNGFWVPPQWALGFDSTEGPRTGTYLREPEAPSATETSGKSPAAAPNKRN
jgi:hypothetical protein